MHNLNQPDWPELRASMESRRSFLRAPLPFIGVLSLTGGMGAAALAVALAWTVAQRFLSYGAIGHELHSIIAAVILGLVASFCSVAGFRLIFFRNDPNAYIVPPALWFTLGAVCLLTVASLYL